MSETAYLKIKVVPKAHRTQLAGWENGELKVRLKAVPEKGKANECLIEFLAEVLNLPKSNITLVSGETSRHKRLRFLGISQTALDRLVLTPP